MQTSLTDKVIIVTGATSGIGLATVRILHKQGARVVAVGHDQAGLDAVAAELDGIAAVRADMTRPSEVQAMIKTVQTKFGRIDVLINNAGQGYEGPVADADIEKYNYIFRLNALGPLTAMQAVVPVMRAQGGGRIINICSPVAKLALPGLGLYASTKAALRVLTLTARTELQKENIAISLFYPFITSSNFGKNTFRTGKIAANPFAALMPNADTPAYTAGKLVAAIGSRQKEISARSSWYFFFGMARKALHL